MSNILAINNWDQLVRAKSESYDNLRIVVTQYNSDKLKGTKISIVDYNTNDVYFTAFSINTEGTLIPQTAKLDTKTMIDCINSYGFNVAISEPEMLTQNVITILQGLYASGYRYIYKDYPAEYNKYINKSKSLYLIWASRLISSRVDGTLITNMPDFVGDEWDWCLPFTTYPISDLIENGYADNGNI